MLLEPEDEEVPPLLPRPEPPEPVLLLSLEVLSLELPVAEPPVPPETPEWLPEESAEPGEEPEPPALCEGLNVLLLPEALWSC